MSEAFKAKGYITFRLGKEDTEYSIDTAEDLAKNSGYPIEMYRERLERLIYDLMSGKEFFEDVAGGGIIDYDGRIADVFVDGYVSNLGLSHRGLNQGNFLLNGDAWLEYCDKFDIKVNWANK